MKVFHQVFLSVVLTLSSLGQVAQGAVDPGRAFFERGQFELAVQTWAEALSKILSEENPKWYIDTSVYLAAAYQKLGRLKEAHKLLETALVLSKKGGDPVRHARVLMHLSDVYVGMRDFQENSMDCGMKEIRKQNKLIPFKRELLMKKAGDLLNQARSIGCQKTKPDYPVLCANILNRQGNIQFLEAFRLYKLGEDYEERAENIYEKTVLRNYEESIKLADKLDAQLSVKAQINIIHGAAQLGDYEKIENELKSLKILQRVEELPDSHDKAFAFMSLAQILQTTGLSETHSPRDYVHYALTKALKVAEKLRDNMAIAYGKFYLAQLYEEAERYHEAILLTKQALFYAQSYPEIQRKIQMEIWGYPELLYRLEWQLGNIFKAQEKHTKDIGEAYKRADKHLKLVRRAYGSFPQRFQNDVETFYKDWADYLLQQYHVFVGEEKQEQEQLQTIIKVIELHKAAEVRNYFQDECITEGAKMITDVDNFLSSHPNTVVLYPILFDDRIELLLSSSNGIQVFKAPTMNKESLNQIINTFKDSISGLSRAVQSSRSQKSSGTAPNTPPTLIEQIEGSRKNLLRRLKDIYGEIIKPIIHVLDNSQIDTLVIVPDDNLRNIPFAALYDGREFLVQKFALAVVPGIKLIDDPTPIQRKNISALLMGSERFNENTAIKKKVDDLPNTIFGLNKISCILKGDTNLLQNKTSILSRNSLAIEKWRELSKKRKKWGELSREGKKFPCEERGKMDILSNGRFTFTEMTEKLKKNSYSIIHFATHAQFGIVPDDTFLLTYDNKITLGMLKELTSITKSLHRPIELLTLSACETAMGDKRAALGLAGVALRAGTRSVLATLWAVDDWATTHLMIEFYRLWKENPNWSKAKALQKAQTLLLDFKIKKNDGSNISPYSHPYFWAPFLLIGDWL